MQRIYYDIYQKREDIGGYWPIRCFILFGFLIFFLFWRETKSKTTNHEVKKQKQKQNKQKQIRKIKRGHNYPAILTKF